MSETQRYKISYETMVAARVALYERVVRIEKILDRFDIDPYMEEYWKDQLKKARKARDEMDAL